LSHQVIKHACFLLWATCNVLFIKKQQGNEIFNAQCVLDEFSSFEQTKNTTYEKLYNYVR